MDIASAGGGSLAAKMAQAVAAARGGSAAASSAAIDGAVNPSSSGQGDFIGSLQSALQAVSQTQANASGMQREFQLENPNVSLEDTMIAMNKSSIAFGAAVQTRNKLVQAYEQIMSMPM